MMKKTTVFLLTLFFCVAAHAQFSFPVIPGPTNVAQGSPVTLSINDVANGAAVPASSSGTYVSFVVTVDWSATGGGPWASEADLALTTSAGTITIDPPTTGSANSGADTTLTFEAEFTSPYDPTTDGLLEITMNQSFGGSSADWSNIVIEIFETPTCPEPSAIAVANITTDSADLSWTVGDVESTWNLEWNAGSDFTPGNGEESGSETVTATPSTTLSGLNSSTAYFVYYRAFCAAGDESLWVGPFNFSTLNQPPPPPNGVTCASGNASFVYTAEFDDVEGWTGDINGGNGSWEIPNDATSFGTGANTAFSGNSFMNYEASGDADDTASAVSPAIDLTNATDGAELSFAMHAFGGDMGTLNIGVGTSAAGPFTNEYSWVGDLQQSADEDWVLIGVNLDAYLGQTIFIEFSHTGTGTGFEGDMSIDFVRVESCGDFCVAPSNLLATIASSTSAELSWTDNSGSTSWNIEWGVAGFAQGTGTIEAAVTTNPFVLNGLMSDTPYEFYVQSICPSSESVWSGPFAFEISYCESDPTSNDGQGIDNVVLNGTTIISFGDETYEDQTATVVDVSQGLSVQNDITFLTGFTYNTNVWIDFNDNFEFEATELVFQGESLSANPTTLDASFTVPATAPLGQHRMRIGSADFGQSTPNPCYNGSFGVTWDITINVIEIPDCPPPNTLTATPLSNTSAELAWTEIGTASSWNVEWGDAGFVQGSGTIEAGVTNPFILNGITIDTPYEYYVQSICTGEVSTWSGPFAFELAYCDSDPTSNDGQGIDNVNIGATNFVSFGDETYEDHTATVVDVFRDLETTSDITFTTGFTYDANIWIDFNSNFEFEASELVFSGTSAFNNPTTLNTSFTIPATAALGEHRMRIGTADSGQATPNPCYNGSFGVTMDFIVNIKELNCVLPEATFAIVEDCDNLEYSIDVDLTSIGDATSIEIFNDFNSDTQQVTTAGVYQVGPFASGTIVKVFVRNEQDNDCTISSETFNFNCPPPNNLPCDAAVASVNTDFICEQRTSGTLAAASSSGVTDPSCGGDPDDDVWFQFVAESEFQLIALANIEGSDTFNIDHSIYEGTCDNLTEIACVNTERSSITPQLTIGETYFIRVYSGGSDEEDTTFDLCITPYIAPTNLTCELAENFCPSSGTSDILYTSNTVDVVDAFGSVACLASTPNPTFSLIEIGSDGDILIEMVQNTAFDENDAPIGGNLDVDFTIWGPILPSTNCEDLLVDCPSCPNNTGNADFYPFGNITDCSYSAQSVENVTIEDASAGDVYLILITNFNGDPGIIQISQTNLGDPDAGGITSEIDVEIDSEEAILVDTGNQIAGFDVDEINLCGFNAVTIEADSPFADTFIWFRDGFVIEGETSSTLTVTESDNYQVQAIDNQCSADALSQIVVVNLYEESPNVDPQVYQECDDQDNDGEVAFDLTDFTATLGLGADFNVSYYLNTGDANQAINAVSSPYTSSGETLIMRIEDSNAFNNGFLGCRQLSEVTLEVVTLPVIANISNIEACDDNDGVYDNVADFDVEILTAGVLGAQDSSIFTVSYHLTQDDANTGANPITGLYSSAGEQLFVRLQSENNTSCFATDMFNLVVLSEGFAEIDTQPFYYSADTGDFLLCTQTGEGIELSLVNANFNANDVTIEWQLNGQTVTGETQTNIVVNTGGVYSAIITDNTTGCTFILDDINVTEINNCEIAQGISPNSDGLNDNFDLRYFNVQSLKIYNRNGLLVYEKENYQNEWIGQSDNGDELPVGTYYYMMIFEGGSQQKDGWIYINR